MADSRAQPGGADGCPGFGGQGSNLVALICAAPPQTKPAQERESCQLSFWAIRACPEKRRNDGFARTPGIKKGAPNIEGPRPRTRTVFVPFPSMTNPSIITLSPVCTGPRVEIFTS